MPLEITKHLASSVPVDLKTSVFDVVVVPLNENLIVLPGPFQARVCPESSDTDELMQLSVVPSKSPVTPLAVRVISHARLDLMADCCPSAIADSISSMEARNALRLLMPDKTGTDTAVITPTMMKTVSISINVQPGLRAGEGGLRQNLCIKLGNGFFI